MELKIEYIPLDEIQPYENNAKEHPKEQIEQIKESIRQFGMDDPIGIWGENNTIVEGHGRLLACAELDMETVPVVRLDHLTDEERRSYTLAHNQLTMNSGCDKDVLAIELDDIKEIGMSDFGFEIDWFNRKNRNDTEYEDGNDEYNEFLDKFEIKKTTDDCYTPDNIYEVVADWVSREYNKSKDNFIRPFYPGGDYENEIYKEGCVVVDNPPFSILSEIVQFYIENGVDFFMFCSGLTPFVAKKCDINYITVGANIVYENGAAIITSFLTNLDEYKIRNCPELRKKLDEANKENVKKLHKEMPVYKYPDEVVTAAKLSYLSKYGQEINISSSDCYRISKLDSMKESKKGIFGAGFLLSEKAAAEKAAAEKAAAEKAAAEKAAAEVWALSEREHDIVKNLGK